MVVFWILTVLFVTLIVLVPLIEKFGPRLSQENIRKTSRLVLPLMAVLLIVQLLFYAFGR